MSRARGNPRDLAATFLGAAAAAKTPESRHQILRRAADVFGQLAFDPRNVHASKLLVGMASDFAHAAAQVSQPPITTTDFEQLLRDERGAWEQLESDGYYPTAAMDALALFNQGGASSSGGAIPGGGNTPDNTTSIAPASFNAGATLGRQATVTFQPTSDQVAQGILQSNTVAFWQGTKREAQAVTIDVGLVAPIQGAPVKSPNCRPFASVEFGSDGNKTSFPFDLGLGRRLTVVGNYVSVIVGMDPPGLVFAGLPVTPMSFGASIGTFAAPAASPLIRTVYVDELTSAVGSGFLPIPLKAAQLLPPQTDQTSGSATIDFYGFGGGAPLVSWTWSPATDQPFLNPIPITGDLFYVQVLTTAAGAVNFRLPFQLSS